MGIGGAVIRAVLGVAERRGHRGSPEPRGEIAGGARRAAERVLGGDPAADLEWLCVERDPDAPGLPATAARIAEEFAQAGLRVEEDRLPPRGRLKWNVLGWLGTPSNEPLTIVVAHYDAVTGTPGADDNASGVAGLLAAARALATEPPPGPVLFAATTLEELGFVGARHLVDRLVRERRAIAGALDLEMIGYTASRQIAPPGLDAPRTGDFIAIVGDTRSREIVGAFSRAAGAGAPDLPVETIVVRNAGRRLPVVRLSDQVPFWDARLPAVMITDTAFRRNPHYHRPSDRKETLDLPFLRRVAAATAATAWSLAAGES